MATTKKAGFTSGGSPSQRETGRYQSSIAGSETVNAFVPHPLPPQSPPISLEGPLQERVAAANQSLQRLELAGEMLPCLDWFIYAFVRKEAVLSSQIEGTQATLVDLLSHQGSTRTQAPDADVEEVCNYVDALKYARQELANPKGLPLSMRLLNRTHELLLDGARGRNKLPGEIRRSQNWIGGSRPGTAAYVPPPPDQLPQLLSDLERYIHQEDELPAILRAGLLHVQFETIHPYLDGNGRIGRLLVSLLLEHWGLLSQPLLYLSLYFKQHRLEYYDHLNAVRIRGDWESWLSFFLTGVQCTADEGVSTCRDLFAIITADRNLILQHERANLLAVQLFERLPSQPIITVPWIVAELQTSPPTASKALKLLVEVGILVETTGKQRDRVYSYQSYLDRLRAGTELTSSDLS